MGGHFRAWVVSFVHEPSFSCVGDRFHATVFMRGSRFRAWAVISMRGRSFPCVGGRLGAWVVVGVGGVIVAHGVIVLWFSWNDSGRVGGAYHVEEQRRTMNVHSSFIIRLPRHRQ